MKKYPLIFFAGQLSGVEGYVESVASGLIAGISMARKIQGKPEICLDTTTIIGALCKHISTNVDNFQPMNANFGILEPLGVVIRDKSLKKLEYNKRAVENIIKFKEKIND